VTFWNSSEGQFVRCFDYFDANMSEVRGNCQHAESKGVRKHLRQSHVADTIRANFPTLGIVDPAKVTHPFGRASGEGRESRPDDEPSHCSLPGKHTAVCSRWFISQRGAACVAFREWCVSGRTDSELGAGTVAQGLPGVVVRGQGPEVRRPEGR
jgi:hypothetical protein